MDNIYTIAGVVIDGNKAREYNRAFSVHGMSVDWSVIEYGDQIAKGMAKAQGMFKDASFCQRCQEIYNSERSKLINYNMRRGLNETGEPLQVESRKENKVMKHNNFKGYLDDAKKICDKAMLEYENIQTTWDNVQEKWNQTQREKISKREMAIAKGLYMQAEDEYNQSLTRLSESVKTQLADIRKEMQEHTDSFYRADPAKLDTSIMTLLNSGILTNDELIHLAEQNLSNVTMLRMIGANINKRLDNSPKRELDANLAVLQYKLSNLGSGEKELKMFDKVSERVMMCVSKDKNYRNAHLKAFEVIFNDCYNTMDTMFARPEVSAE